MNRNHRDNIIEPKGFFSRLWKSIPWIKVLIFVLLTVFFVNVGLYIYDKKNPEKSPEEFAYNKIDSPYGGENEGPKAPHQLFGVPKSEAKNLSLSAPLDAKKVFDKQTNKGKNVAPVAKAKIVTTNQQTEVRAGDTVFLSASDSYDPDGTVKQYRWDFDQSNGLGIDSEGANTTVKYNSAGVYTVTLLVIDDKGKEATTTLTVSVSAVKSEQSNQIIQGLTTKLIDIDALNFMGRGQVQSAMEGSYADFSADSYSMLAQSIYNSQKKKLPQLPSIADIDIAIGKDPSNVPPKVESVNPKDGASTFDKKPFITSTFSGKNSIDQDSVSLLVDGKPVSQSDMVVSPFGVQYKPSEDMGYGDHSAMITVEDDRGLKTAKSWSFRIDDPKRDNAEIAPEYKDVVGPKVILTVPDQNAKEVKPSSDILVNYNEPVKKDSLEVAVVDLTTNITKFFTKSQVEFNANATGIAIKPNENIFENDRAYQIVVRQEDQLGNKSTFDWYVMAEEYKKPKFEITGPEQNSSTNKPEITVVGFTDPTYRMSVADKVAEVDQNGAFKASLSLKRGKNEILVKAVALDGKESSQYLVVTYDPNANGGNPILDTQESPVIMDASIRDKQVTNKIRPQISYVFADTDGIDRASVKLLVDDKDVTAESFVARDSVTYKPLQNLEQGEHKVQIIVSDTKGNTTDYVMHFTVDAYPDKPTNLKSSLTNNNESVLLVWDGVTNITNPEYRVYRSTQPNVAVTSGTEVKRGLTSTSWTDNDVVTGVTYYYVVAAVTKDGNLSKASNETKIKVDSVAPTLHVVSPESKKFETNKDSHLIQGVTEKDATVEVFVNFVSVGKPKVNSDGTFEQQVKLLKGENVIMISAKDKDGNESVDIRTITYIPPDVDAPYPVEKSPMGTDVDIKSNIKVTYNEQIDPKTLKVVLKTKDNKEEVIPVSVADVALQVSKDQKTITYNPRNDLEFEQVYSVEVRVKDLAGNESVNDDWSFETQMKDAPALEVITPIPNFFVDMKNTWVTGKTEPNIKVTIRVTSAGGESDPAKTTEYKIQSQPDGFFKQLVNLYEYKENTITVIATDKLGHASMKVITGLVSPKDYERPLLVVTSPITNSTVNKEVITVTGKTETNTRVTMTVNGEKQQDFDMGSEINFSKSIRLKGGQNLIKIISTDPSGNQSVEPLVIYYDNNPPLLEVINPIDKLSTNQSRVEVRGMTEKKGVEVEITIGSTKLYVDVLEDGSFNKFINLAVGNNAVIVRGTDDQGNITTVIRNVFYDPTGGVNMGTNTGNAGTGPAANDVDGASDGKTDDGKATTGSESKGSESKGSTDVSGNSSTGAINPSTNLPNYNGSPDHQSPDTITVKPTHNSDTKDSSIKFEGKTEEEATVTTWQNGKQIINQSADVNDGSFGKDAKLEEGRNVFITNSQDASGNTSQNLTVINLDTTGPATTVLKPRPKEVIKDKTYTVYGSTERNSTVKIEVTNGGGTKTVKSDEFGVFTADLSMGPSGAKTVIVTASDKLGNQTVKKVPITVDITPPPLTVTKLNTTSISGATSTPSGAPTFNSKDVTSIVSGKTSPNITVEAYSNNRLVGNTKSNTTGNYTVDVAAKAGEATLIKILARDDAGNETTLYFKLNADSDAPKVFIFAPGALKATPSGGSTTVKGTVEDENNPSVITYRLNGGSVKTGVTTSDARKASFTFPVSGLQAGSNRIDVYVKDAVGNVTQSMVAIVMPDVDIAAWIKAKDALVRDSVSKDTVYYKDDAKQWIDKIIDAPAICSELNKVKGLNGDCTPAQLEAAKTFFDSFLRNGGLEQLVDKSDDWYIWLDSSDGAFRKLKDFIDENGIGGGSTGSTGPVEPQDHGDYVHPVSGGSAVSEKYEGHTGVDYGGPEGTPILAVKDGVINGAVNFQGNTHPTPNFGTYVKINHGNGLETLYGHLLYNSITVKVGDVVKKGQMIGKRGNTGNSTGPHLHFEVRINGSWVSPKSVFPEISPY